MKKKRVSLGFAFRNVIWPNRKYLTIGLMLIIISRLSGLVLPGASKFLIDDVIPSGDLSKLYRLLSVVIGSLFLQAISNFLLSQTLSVQSYRLIADLRQKVQKHILQMPVRYFDNNKSGELVSRIMKDVEGIRNFIGRGLVQMVGGIITSIVSMILLIRISPSMTLYVFIPVTLFGLIALKAFTYIRPIFRESGKINADVTGRLTETLNGIRVIKGFNAEAHEEKTFREGVIRLFQNTKKSITSTSLVTSSSGFLLGLASVGIMGIGGWMIINDKLTFGEFLSFSLYLGFMITPIVQMSSTGTQLTEAFAGLDRTQEVLQQTNELNTARRIAQVERINGKISFDNVSFAYEPGNTVLHNITFQAPPGTVTALVGTSGSGKSTLASLVATFISPSSGTIFLDDTDLSTITLNSYRQNLGVVLQDDFLFEGTVRENILFSRPNSTEEEVNYAVKVSHVKEFTDRFDKGLDTIIGERGVKLSGGQRQRVAIARAVLANPEILILDEATSNLDTESEAYIQESLKTLMKGRTTFVIAHRLSTIKQADNILVIEKGEILEQGNHDSLLSLKGRYHELYTYQARI